MAFCYFTSSTFTSQKLGISGSLEQHFKREPQQWGACSFLIMATTAKNSSSRRKLKARMPTKSNIDICQELREFNSITGLPPTHVPSLKELSQNGRQDLANIVRRRGYKLITELLRDSTAKTDSTIERGSSEMDIGNSSEKKPTGQDKKKSDLVEAVSLSSRKGFLRDSHIPSANGVLPSNIGNHVNEPIESSISSLLREKAANFIRSGELNITEDALEVEDAPIPGGSNLGFGILDQHDGDASNLCTELDAETEIKTIGTRIESSMPHANKSNATSIMNTSGGISEDATQRHDISPSEGETDTGSFDDNLAAEDSKRDHKTEIDQLKALLHQKELELIELKQQIENETVTLSLLQTKATTEIGSAQRVGLEKDAQLLAAEESLCGLKEVRIDYWGDGEVVEVAGSFNGWHHWIKMELDHLPEVTNPSRSRGSVLWSVVLWLYPGIYEIKFIVDGHWRIDPSRELISKGNIQNNILRVDR